MKRTLASSVALLSIVACSASPESDPEAVSSVAQPIGIAGPAFSLYQHWTNGQFDQNVWHFDTYQASADAKAWGLPKTVSDNVPYGSKSGAVTMLFYSSGSRVAYSSDWTVGTSFTFNGVPFLLKLTNLTPQQWMAENEGGGGSQYSTESWKKDVFYSQVCSRWKSDRANLTNGTWTGTGATQCLPGDLTNGGRESALRLVNLYRWIAGLPELTATNTLNQREQQCALIEHENLPIWGQLYHRPLPTNPTPLCYSAEREDATASNISSWGPLDAIDDQMVDQDSIRAGHRRVLLKRVSGGSIGIGSAEGVSGYSDVTCVTVDGGTPFSYPAGFAAWPPPGYIPKQALVVHNKSVDTAGWSVDADQDLAGAQVTVSRLDGTAWTSLAVDAHTADDNSHVMLIKPNPSWQTTKGQTYRVRIAVNPPIEYTFGVLDCS
jgi:hypothetical protein